MIAIYLNRRYNALPLSHFDLEFDEDGVQMLRLSCVPFEEGFTQQDMIDRATEIFEGNFSSEEYQLTEIIIY